MTGYLPTFDPEDVRCVGSIVGTDIITEIHVTNLLLYQGIWAAIEGSRTHAILVPSARAEEASQLLRADARRRDYYISFESGEVVDAPELKEVVHGVSVSSLLKRTDFAIDTALGRLLRSAEISPLTEKYLYMFSLCAHERRYLVKLNTYANGCDVRFELHRSARKRSDGCQGRCQLLDDGRGIEFHGASEWGSLIEAE